MFVLLFLIRPYPFLSPLLIYFRLLDVLHFAKFMGAPACLVPQNLVQTVLPRALCRFVQIYQYPDKQVSILTVNTAEMQTTQRWEVADALVSAMSQANVLTLTIVAALHLPYAKDDGLNVFYSGLGPEVTDDVDLATLSAADPMWEVKDPWLAALVHLIKIEQWPRTHLLLAKAYKPGRDLGGMCEAMDALGRALELFTKNKVMIDSQQMHRDLPKVLAKENKRTTTTDSLLYH